MVKESEHKEFSNTDGEHAIDMAELQKTNGNAGYPAHDSTTRAQVDGAKALNAKALNMAAATIRSLQEMAEAKRAAAAAAQVDSIQPSHNNSSHANDDVGRISKTVGEMVIENGRRVSIGLRQESPSKGPDRKSVV